MGGRECIRITATETRHWIEEGLVTWAGRTLTRARLNGKVARCKTVGCVKGTLTLACARIVLITRGIDGGGAGIGRRYTRRERRARAATGEGVGDFGGSTLHAVTRAGRVVGDLIG